MQGRREQIQKAGPIIYIAEGGSGGHALKCVLGLMRLLFVHAYSKYLPASCRLCLAVSDKESTGPQLVDCAVVTY